ncbi:MAG TPA: C1 family peptidase, partial [bacterium]|nr:C1 family peptidase [bacterium]
MRKRIYNSFIFAVGIACLIVLAGCGDGGGGGVSAPTRTEQTINNEIQRQGASWRAAENQISQLPEAERRSLNGLIPETNTATRVAMKNELSAAQLPTALDWRDRDGVNWVTSVKTQGVCGSCVAFASLGVAEAVTRIAGNNAVLDADLSESDLFSCGGSGGLCSSGWRLSSAANKLKDQGVVDEACLPYQAADNVCAGKCSSWESRVSKIDSWVWSPADGASIKNYLLQGPVLASMKVYTDFFYYQSGTYQHVWGELEGHHAVAIVGYNDAGQYWIAKNSWGTAWGESGFFKIKYGDSEIENNVIALQKASNPAGVTASVFPTSATLSGGQAQVTLTCSANGTVSLLEGRCNSTDAWSSIPTGATKTCTYSAAGSYTPGCRVNGASSDNVDSPVTVYTAVNLLPTASASASASSGTAPLAVNFTGGCTDADGTCVTYSWNFGDGSTTSSSQNPSHTFTTAGTFTVTLTVTDDRGGTGTATRTITVSPTVNQSPTASASASATYGAAPLAVNFTGGCTDPDGTCVTYSWDFGDGSSTSSSQSPSHTFTTAGTFMVRLIATDNSGATDQKTVIVEVYSSVATQPKEISEGMHHTCALLNNGNVKCWGDNSSGQLGDGTTTERRTPTDVSSLSGVK